MKKKESLKTIFTIVKNISLMIVLYSSLSSNLPIFIKKLSISSLAISLVALFVLRKEKPSYETNRNGILEKIYSLTSIVVSILALWILIYIFIIDK